MALFLNILKIIGIILLCILALLLVLLLLALFCPAVYRIKGEKQDKLLLHARISWLFPLIYGNIKYEGQLSCILYLLGIPVYDVLGEKPVKSKKTEKERKKEKKKKEKRKQKGKRKEDNAAKKRKGSKRAEKKKENNTENHIKNIRDIEDVENAGRENQEKQSREAYSDIRRQKTVMEEKTEGPRETDILENPEMADKHDEEEKPSIFQKVKLFFQKIFEKVRNIKYTILNMKEKLENLKETVYWYKEVLEREESGRAITKGKKQLLKFLNHVKPKKVKGNVLFGFGDPGTTGEVLGFISMFYPLFGNHITVTPDFERTIFQGDFYIKGRMRAFNLLRFGWSVFFDKDIKNLYNILTGGKNHE